MGTYFVKIDTNSIKLNENRGETTTRIRTGKTAKFKAQYLPDDFIDGDNCVIFSWQEINGKKTNVEGEIINDELIDKIFIEKRKGIEIEIQFHSQQFEHCPISKYSYNYENTEVICCECEEKVMTNDLKSDGGEYYSDKICPKCGKFDCCSLKYEKID